MKKPLKSIIPLSYIGGHDLPGTKQIFNKVDRKDGRFYLTTAGINSVEP
jgi:hypothetical protein